MLDPIAPLVAHAVNGKPYSDPAIESGIKEYTISRDASVLKLHPGRKLVGFVIRRLTAASVGALDTIDKVSTRAQLAFRLACHEVQLENGTFLKSTDGKAQLTTWNDEELAPEEWLERISRKFGTETVYEMGRLAQQRARLPEGWDGPFDYSVG